MYVCMKFRRRSWATDKDMGAIHMNWSYGRKLKFTRKEKWYRKWRRKGIWGPSHTKKDNIGCWLPAVVRGPVTIAASSLSCPTTPRTCVWFRCPRLPHVQLMIINMIVTGDVNSLDKARHQGMPQTAVNSKILVMLSALKESREMKPRRALLGPDH